MCEPGGEKQGMYWITAWLMLFQLITQLTMNAQNTSAQEPFYFGQKRDNVHLQPVLSKVPFCCVCARLSSPSFCVSRGGLPSPWQRQFCAAAAGMGHGNGFSNRGDTEDLLINVSASKQITACAIKNGEQRAVVTFFIQQQLPFGQKGGQKRGFSNCHLAKSLCHHRNEDFRVSVGKVLSRHRFV